MGLATLTSHLIMTKLISKVQCKNFEAGEFIDVQERDYEETIDLIKKFPWHREREKIVSDLTNPSVTIEGKNNDFLKIAVFFNQKYVLHYFDKKEVLYSKSFINLDDGQEYIKRYFEQPEFAPTNFKKENTWLQHNLMHFVTQDFRYVLSRKSAINYLLATCGLSFCLYIVVLVLILWDRLHPSNASGIVRLLLAMFVIGGGGHLILFFNYYNYAKKKILTLSKGNDSFYFGDIDDPLSYDKKDIARYTTIKMGGSRSIYSGFAIVEIEFKNGTLLKIPNLLLDESELRQKLFEYPGTEKNEFPYLRT